MTEGTGRNVYTALQIIETIEPPKSPSNYFYTDENAIGITQLNYGYGLDITQNGEDAIDEISAGLDTAGVSDATSEDILADLEDYVDNPSQVTGDSSTLVTELNSDLVSLHSSRHQ